MHTKLKTLSRSVVLASLMAGWGWVAIAQTNPAAPKPMASASAPMKHESHSGSERSMHGRMDPATMETTVANHLAELKGKLKISPAQEASWTLFTAAMKPSAQPDRSHPDRAEMDKLTTPERIDRVRSLRAQHMADRQAIREKRESAI